MTALVHLIETIAPGLYFLSVAGIIYMGYRLIRARHELAVAQFKLEREQALVKRANAITFGGLLIEFAIGVWAIATLVAPPLEKAADPNSPNAQDLERFVTSTPAPNAPLVLDINTTGDDGEIIFMTPEPSPTPVGTIIPDAPDIVGCPRDSAWLNIPGNGQLIFESTTIMGVAATTNFAFYRFEVRKAQAGAEFAVLGGDHTTQVISEGPLGEIEPRLFAEMGEYRFRLTVFDNTQMPRASCEVTIHISAPPLTPTPLPGTPTPSS